MDEETQDTINTQTDGEDIAEPVKDEATINLEGWKKALADYQNLQRESDQRLAQLNDFVLSSVVSELLPIFDNYEIALSHVPPDQKKDSWVQGLEHTLKLWQNFLRDHKIERIISVGHSFDPNTQEAVGHITDEKQEDQIVVQEVQAGYTFQQSVLRPAKVIINNIN